MSDDKRTPVGVFGEYGAQRVLDVCRRVAAGELTLRFIGSEHGDRASYCNEHYFFAGGVIFGHFIDCGDADYTSLVATGQHSCNFPASMFVDDVDGFLEALGRAYEAAEKD